jgi:peptidoglycan/xylan/chitin deacetylase (PgdA/CDA1 family)
MAVKTVATVIDPLFGPLPGPRILIYHQVGVNFGREMEVSTETFTKQLDWIQEHGEIVDLETAIERWTEPGAEKLFVLTFDDGFEDMYHNAFPLMKEQGIPFTLYLTTRPIETGEPLDPMYSDARPFTWDQVNEMAATGLATLGAHTHTHPDLRKATTSQISEELDTSDMLILERTGVAPKHFTYPWGWSSETADPFVQERYESSTIGGTTRKTQTAQPHLVSRLPVQRSDSAPFFSLRMKRGLRLEEGIRSVRSRYR